MIDPSHSRRSWATVGCLTTILGLLIVSGPAAASYRLPSRATQIATLKRVEANVNREIAADGADQADYDLVTVADLRSFDIEPLWNRGIDGAHTTVAVIEGWNMPKIQAYLQPWDDLLGLPKPDIETVYPAGRLPSRCPAGMQALRSYGSCSAWQGELELDVESVHLFAPYAKIVISATPADTQIRDDASAQVAPPEMMRALEYLSRRHLANVVSISDGSNETDYRHGAAEIRAQDLGPMTSAVDGVPVLNATGDCGAGQELARGDGFCNDLAQGETIGTWADSPFVTAVGGVTPSFTFSGPGGQDQFSVWNIGFAAENAGLSRVYHRPFYQDGVAARIGAPWRSVPDITMDAENGTSEAAPQMAGILSLATQLHGRDLGPINQALYEDLGPQGSSDGIVDVTQGNDAAYGRKGYAAGPGYDIATGWGTVNAAKFVPALVAAVSKQDGFGLLANQAAEQISKLEHAGRVQPAHVGAGGRLKVTSRGFLPVHPVKVAVDERRAEVIRADGHGDLSFSLPLNSLHLAPGRHTLTLTGMLLTQRISFTVRG